jgi:hypothetical protein
MEPECRCGNCWVILLAFLIAALGACGGSGSSAESPPPINNPPSQPVQPSVEFSASEETMLSGATLGLTVSGTGDGVFAESISISCSDSIEAVVDGHKVEIAVPTVSILTESECIATVLDAHDQSATDTLAITILPLTSIGQMVGRFDPALKLALPNFNVPSGMDSYGNHVVTISDSSDMSGMKQIKAIEGTSFVPMQYHRDDIVLVEGDYLSIDYVQSPSLYAHGLPDASMSIVSEQENKVYWLLQDLQTRDFSIRNVIDVNRPCFVSQTETYWGNDLIIGQVKLGLTVFDVETGSDSTTTENFEATPIHSIGAGRSLCHVLRGIVPDSIAQQFPGFTGSSPFDPPYALPLTAVDYESLELVFYGDVNADNALDEMGVLPIETNAAGSLRIIQVISRGGPTQSPQYLIVLLSDGQHDGEHRLIQINFDEDTYEYTQQVLHQWNEGIPVSMLQGPLGGSMEGGLYRPDLAVILGTADQSFFFDNLSPLDDGFGLPPEYGAPTVFDVGAGAGSAVAVASPFGPSLTAPDHGILVSYPDDGSVFYISLPVAQ